MEEEEEVQTSENVSSAPNIKAEGQPTVQTYENTSSDPLLYVGKGGGL
jgi:hypothetical protein